MRFALGDRELEHKCIGEKRSMSYSSSQRTKAVTRTWEDSDTTDKIAHPTQATPDRRKRSKDRREGEKRRGRGMRRRRRRRRRVVGRRGGGKEVQRATFTPRL